MHRFKHFGSYKNSKGSTSYTQNVEKATRPYIYVIAARCSLRTGGSGDAFLVASGAVWGLLGLRSNVRRGQVE
jgi:hypothetical protein